MCHFVSHLVSSPHFPSTPSSAQDAQDSKSRAGFSLSRKKYNRVSMLEVNQNNPCDLSNKNGNKNLNGVNVQGNGWGGGRERGG